MPHNPDQYWHGWGKGVFCWTLQTFLRLQASGFSCQLVNNLPDEGIIFAYRQSIPNNFLPNPKTLLVCLQGDKGRHPYAQVHIVQNPELTKPSLLGDRYLLSGENFYN